jgi:hypothetical protein
MDIRGSGGGREKHTHLASSNTNILLLSTTEAFDHRVKPVDACAGMDRTHIDKDTKMANQAWRKKPRQFAPKSRLGCKTCK